MQRTSRRAHRVLVSSSIVSRGRHFSSKSVFANAELSSSSKRCVACLHLDYPSARYPVFPPTCIYADRRRQIDRANLFAYVERRVTCPIVRSLSHNDQRQTKGTCVYELSGHPTARECGASNGDHREKRRFFEGKLERMSLEKKLR